MSRIKVERRPSPERLKELGVNQWPIWTKEAVGIPLDLRRTGDLLFSGRGGDGHRRGRGNGTRWARATW